ncbi:endoplasmic reticulum aminopeptidase 1-like [Cherax quadricarinatus]|uniref:endoplasmic reticulum aminopeptidase 1-like n=1 Tax=Cherax quadricarinatus TaxID=27406 RepID=UPI00387E9379
MRTLRRSPAETPAWCCWCVSRAVLVLLLVGLPLTTFCSLRNRLHIPTSENMLGSVESSGRLTTSPVGTSETIVTSTIPATTPSESSTDITAAVATTNIPKSQPLNVPTVSKSGRAKTSQLQLSNATSTTTATIATNTPPLQPPNATINTTLTSDMLVMKPNTTTTTTTTDAPHLQSPNTTPTTIITISNTLPSQQPNATEATTTSEGVKVVVLSSDPAHQNKQDLFLPKTLKPLHYTIKIQPFINGNQTIHGYMEVEVEVLEPTSNITMHFFNMNIDTNTVKLAAMEDKERKEGGRLKKEHNEGLPTVEYISVDIRRQFFTAHLTGQLQRGSRFLYSMSYVASLNNYRSGFFSAHYSDNDGTQRRLMATLLQPTNARKAFPCFDEPELKATFELYVTREINMTAISNMPLRNTTPMEGQEGWMVDQFVTSPLMSTYHLVLIISQLHYVDATNDGGVPIRIWARPDVLEKTSMIQQVVPKLLSFFEDYLSVPYSLPKLDFVAVPSGFGVAFEGWGIIVGFE